MLSLQYIECLDIKIFDKDFRDLTPKKLEECEPSNAYTPIASDRFDIMTLPFKKKEVKYKIYTSSNIRLSVDTNSSPFNVLVFKDLQELLKTYKEISPQKNISLILAVETDFKQKKKIKHKVSI